MVPVSARPAFGLDRPGSAPRLRLLFNPTLGLPEARLTRHVHNDLHILCVEWCGTLCECDRDRKIASRTDKPFVCESASEKNVIYLFILGATFITLVCRLFLRIIYSCMIHCQVSVNFAYFGLINLLEPGIRSFL